MCGKGSVKPVNVDLQWRVLDPPFCRSRLIDSCPAVVYTME